MADGVVTLLLLALAMNANAAPLFNEVTDDFSLDRDCLYDGKMYPHGFSMEMEDPCLNCTCNRGVLVCFLRVCPNLVPPPDSGCTLAKTKGRCCAELVCENKDSTATFQSSVTSSTDGSLTSQHGRQEEDVSATLAATSTDNSDAAGDYDVTPSPSDFIVHDDAINLGCRHNGSLYAEGSAMLSSSFCEYCYCIRGQQRCIRPQCHLRIDDCAPIYHNGYSCCPTAYQCNRSKTDMRPFTTTVSSTHAHRSKDCLVNGTKYGEGHPVTSGDPCSHCFCVNGAVRCSIISCPLHMDGCIPIIQPRKCCPTGYNCSVSSSSGDVPGNNSSSEMTTDNVIHSTTKQSLIEDNNSSSAFMVTSNSESLLPTSQSPLNSLSTNGQSSGANETSVTRNNDRVILDEENNDINVPTDSSHSYFETVSMTPRESLLADVSSTETAEVVQSTSFPNEIAGRLGIDDLIEGQTSAGNISSDLATSAHPLSSSTGNDDSSFTGLESSTLVYATSETSDGLEQDMPHSLEGKNGTALTSSVENNSVQNLDILAFEINQTVQEKNSKGNDTMADDVHPHFEENSTSNLGVDHEQISSASTPETKLTTENKYRVNDSNLEEAISATDINYVYFNVSDASNSSLTENGDSHAVIIPGEKTDENHVVIHPNGSKEWLTQKRNDSLIVAGDDVNDEQHENLSNAGRIAPEAHNGTFVNIGANDDLAMDESSPGYSALLDDKENVTVTLKLAYDKIQVAENQTLLTELPEPHAITNNSNLNFTNDSKISAETTANETHLETLIFGNPLSRNGSFNEEVTNISSEVNATQDLNSEEAVASEDILQAEESAVSFVTVSLGNVSYTTDSQDIDRNIMTNHTGHDDVDSNVVRLQAMFNSTPQNNLTDLADHAVLKHVSLSDPYITEDSLPQTTEYSEEYNQNSSLLQSSSKPLVVSLSSIVHSLLERESNLSMSSVNDGDNHSTDSLTYFLDPQTSSLFNDTVNFDVLLDDFVGETPGEVQLNAISYVTFNDSSDKAVVTEQISTVLPLRTTSHSDDVSVTADTDREVTEKYSSSKNNGKVTDQTQQKTTSLPAVIVQSATSVSVVQKVSNFSSENIVKTSSPQKEVISTEEISFYNDSSSTSLQKLNTSLKIDTHDQQTDSALNISSTDSSTRVNESLVNVVPTVAVNSTESHIQHSDDSALADAEVLETRNSSTPDLVETDLEETLQMILNLSKTYADMNKTIPWRPHNDTATTEDILLQGTLPFEVEAKIAEIVRLAQAGLNTTENPPLHNKHDFLKGNAMMETSRFNQSDSLEMTEVFAESTTVLPDEFADYYDYYSNTEVDPMTTSSSVNNQPSMPHYNFSSESILTALQNIFLPLLNMSSKHSSSFTDEHFGNNSTTVENKHGNILSLNTNYKEHNGITEKIMSIVESTHPSFSSSQATSLHVAGDHHLDSESQLQADHLSGNNSLLQTHSASQEMNNIGNHLAVNEHADEHSQSTQNSVNNDQEYEKDIVNQKEEPMEVEPPHVEEDDYFSHAEVVVPDEEKSYFGADDFNAGASRTEDIESEVKESGTVDANDSFKEHSTQGDVSKENEAGFKEHDSGFKEHGRIDLKEHSESGFKEHNGPMLLNHNEPGLKKQDGPDLKDHSGIIGFKECDGPGTEKGDCFGVYPDQEESASDHKEYTETTNDAKEDDKDESDNISLHELPGFHKDQDHELTNKGSSKVTNQQESNAAAVATDIDQLEAASGQIHTENVEGHGHVEIASDHGHVEVPSSHGHVEVSSSHGHVKDPSNHEHVEVPNDQGHVKVPSDQGHVEAGNDQGHTDVASGQGHVEAGNDQGHTDIASGQGHVEAGNDQGHVEVANDQGPTDVASGQAHVDADSDHGHVAVTNDQGHTDVASGQGHVAVASDHGQMEVSSGNGYTEATNGHDLHQVITTEDSHQIRHDHKIKVEPTTEENTLPPTDAQGDYNNKNINDTSEIKAPIKINDITIAFSSADNIISPDGLNPNHAISGNLTESSFNATVGNEILENRNEEALVSQPSNKGKPDEENTHEIHPNLQNLPTSNEPIVTEATITDITGSAFKDEEIEQHISETEAESSTYSEYSLHHDSEDNQPLDEHLLPAISQNYPTTFVGLVSKGSIVFDDVLPLSRRGRPNTDEKTGLALPTPRKSHYGQNSSFEDVSVNPDIKVIPFLPEDAISDELHKEPVKANFAPRIDDDFGATSENPDSVVHVIEKNDSTISVRVGSSSVIQVQEFDGNTTEEESNLTRIMETVLNDEHIYNESESQQSNSTGSQHAEHHMDVDNSTSLLPETTIFVSSMSTATVPTVHVRITTPPPISSTTAVVTSAPEVNVTLMDIESTASLLKQKENKRIDILEPLVTNRPVLTEGLGQQVPPLRDVHHHTSDYCVENGELFQDGERIPTLDFCAQCRCNKGEILCQHVACPRRPPGCVEKLIQNFCCPSFVCNETDSFDDGSLPLRSGITIHGGFRPIERPILPPQDDRHRIPQHPPLPLDLPSSLHNEYMTLSTTLNPTTVPHNTDTHIIENTGIGHEEDSKLISSGVRSPEVTNTGDISLDTDSIESHIKEVTGGDSDNAVISAAAATTDNASPKNVVKMTTFDISSTTVTTTSVLPVHSVTDKQRNEMGHTAEHETKERTVIPTETDSPTTISTTVSSTAVSSIDVPPKKQPSKTFGSGGGLWPMLKVSGCNIYGRLYQVGSTVGVLSGPCKECKCSESGVECYRIKCF